MKIELYEYGLSNTLKEIEELLENALLTTNKNKKNNYISEAYGMVQAVDILINEEVSTVASEEPKKEPKKEEIE